MCDDACCYAVRYFVVLLCVAVCWCVMMRCVIWSCVILCVV